MRTERMSNGEPLFELVIEEMSAAPPDAVYDLLEDLRQHAVWGGTQQKKSYRLASIDAPPGPASVGIEFRSVGIDPGGAFADTSVVTEATRPTVFEFVTEARQQPKRGGVIEWTNVNRYELASRQGGTSIRYSIRVMRLSRPRWWTSPRMHGIARRILGVLVRRGVKNLARMAEHRPVADPAA